MKVARFWVRESATLVDERGREHSTVAWGWSSDSVEEASLRAKSAAERIIRWVVGPNNNDPTPSAQYQYFGGRPPREEILQEFHDASGETFATITRNIYGSTVLNCRDFMFIDIDCREPPALLRWVRAIFGIRGPTRRSEAGALQNISYWSSVNPHTALKVYRTAAGLRVAIVDRSIQANDPDVHGILKELERSTNPSSAVAANWRRWAITRKGIAMKAYSSDLRERVLLDCDAGMETRQAAVKHRVSESWIRRLKQRRRDTGETTPRPCRNRRVAKWLAYADRLQELVRQQPDATLGELATALGGELRPQTISRALKTLRLTFKKSASRRGARPARRGDASAVVAAVAVGNAREATGFH